MNSSTAKAGKISPGVILLILVITSVAAPLSLNKVSPIAPNIKDYFNIGESQIGILISVFSITGIALALPGGLLIRKLGQWKSVLLALTALLAGSLVGIFSGSFTALLVSRIIEGIGMALIVIAGPSIVGSTVSTSRRGLAMGFFSAYFGIGQVLIFNLAPRIAKAGSWKNVWWFSSAYILFSIIVWIILMIKIKAFSKSHDVLNAPEEKSIPLVNIFKNRSLWILTIANGAYIISFGTIQMFLPSYLSSNRGLDIAYASSLVSLNCLAGTVFSLFAGIISDKLGSRRVLGGMSLIVSGALFLLIPVTKLSLFLPLIIILGIIPPIFPVCAYAAATEVIDDPSESSMAIGLLSMGQNIGFTLGPALFGAVVQGISWNTALFLTMPVAVIGGLLTLFNKRVK